MQQGAGLAFPAAAAASSGDGATGGAGIGFVRFGEFVAAVVTLVTFIAFAAVVPFGAVSVAAAAAGRCGLGVCGGIAVGVGSPPVRLEAFDAFDCQVVTGQLFDGFKHFLFGFVHQGNGNAVRACPTGASDAVDVVFGLGWQFVVDDKGQLGDVQSACGDVGGDEDAQAAFFEGVEGFEAALLGFVAVDGLGGEVSAHEVAGNLVDALFGFAEHDDLVHLQIDNQPL